MIYYKDFQQKYLKIELQPPIYRISLDDILYMFLNKHKLKKIIKHFYKKLTE